MCLAFLNISVYRTREEVSWDSFLKFLMKLMRIIQFFFFQAEDGIRDWSVTGVQTCALPICANCGRLGYLNIAGRSRPNRVVWPRCNHQKAHAPEREDGSRQSRDSESATEPRPFPDLPPVDRRDRRDPDRKSVV